jgi:hypothetical protein
MEETTVPGPKLATLCKCVITPKGVTRARIFHFSCLLPEATRFEAKDMPKIQKEAGVMRILVIAGNLTHFAGDLDMPLMDFFLKGTTWDHVILVPGPYDYGSQTLNLCDSYLGLLAQYNKDRFTVLGNRRGDFTPPSIFFTGVKLLIVGAPCWPSNPEAYKRARVYEYVEGTHSCEKDAVGVGHFVTRETAEKRLKGDIESIFWALKHDWAKEGIDVASRVVVSYGCPSEFLALESGCDASNFCGTFKLGDAATFKALGDAGVTEWIYGAAGDVPVQTMGSVTYRKNHYLVKHSRFEVMQAFDVGEKKKKVLK